MHRIPPIRPRRERMPVRQWLAICGGTAQRMRRYWRRLTALMVFCVASVGWAACGHGEDGGPLLFDPSPGAISPPTANTPPPPAGGWRAAGASAGARRDYPQTGAPSILPSNQRQATPLAAQQQTGPASAPAVESATPHGARSPVSSPAPAQGWRSWRPIRQSESAPAQSGQAPSAERDSRGLSAGGTSNPRPAPYANVPPVSTPPAAAPRTAPASPQRGAPPVYGQGGPKNASSPSALPQTAQPRSAAPQAKEPWWERFRIGDGRLLRALGIGRSEPDSKWTPLRQPTNSAGADHRWPPSQPSDRQGATRYAPGNQRKRNLGIPQNGNTRLQPQRPTLPQGSGGRLSAPRMAPGSLNPTAPQRLPEQTPPASRLPQGMYRGQQARSAAQRPNVFERAADSVQQWWSDLTQSDTARSASMPRPQALPRPRPFERVRQWLSTPLQSDRGIFGRLRSNQLSQNDRLPQDPFSKRREQWQAISETPAGASRLPPARGPVPKAQSRPGSLWQPLRN